MATLELDRVDKTYPNGYVAARALSLAVADGELLVLVGPSGSGKSTILRLVAGLEPVTGGRIRIGGDDVTDLPPQRRDVAMVFQSYALYPHLTVRENLGFGLRIRKERREVIERRVREVAESLGLGALLDRRPAQLSGGERQRVAVGRAIVREPRLFLLDEPLSNLDAQLRVETRLELARLHRRLAATMVYVTHDQTEALTLGDRIAVLDRGVLQQVASPLEIYRRPANRFVAGFIGSPAMSFLEGTVRADAGGRRFEGRGLVVPIGAPRDEEGATPLAADGEAVSLGVRPQGVALLDGSAAERAGDARVVVRAIEQLGSEQVAYCETAGGERLVATLPADARVAVDEHRVARLAPEGVHLFRASDGARVR